MRIKVFYHSSLNDLEPEKRSLLVERIVPRAVEYWEDIIRVRNPVRNIKLNRRCLGNQYYLSPGESVQYCKEECVKTMCGEFQVPESHLTDCHTCDSRGANCGKRTDGGPGVSGVDFVLYVSSLTTNQCLEAVGGKAETVAYAAHCQQEESLDRPVAGHTNICPGAISSLVSPSIIVVINVIINIIIINVIAIINIITTNVIIIVVIVIIIIIIIVIITIIIIIIMLMLELSQPQSPASLSSCRRETSPASSQLSNTSSFTPSPSPPVSSPSSETLRVSRGRRGWRTGSRRSTLSCR